MARSGLLSPDRINCMANNLFKKYLWLMNTIKSFGPISYDSINRLWERSALNELGEELPKKTFHNQLNAISDLFDIEILCDRKNGYRYYIGESLSHDKWTQNYLNSMLFQFSLLDDKNMKDVVYDIDNENDIDERLYFIIGCIKNHLVISFTYKKSHALLRESEPKIDAPDKIRKYTGFAPIALIHADRIWYVIGCFTDTNTIVPIQLHHIYESFINEDVTYKADSDFSARKYVESFSYDCLELNNIDNDSSEFNNAILFSSFKTRT